VDERGPDGVEVDRVVDSPPHAPPARMRPEDPLAAAERLLADSASELTDDQNWDTFAEIDDGRQRAQGLLTLLDRLAQNVDRHIQVRVGGQGELGVDAGGRLVEVGDGWIELADQGVTRLVNVAAIISVVGLSRQMTGRDTVTRRRSLPSVLRQLAVSSRTMPISLLRCDGRLISAEIVRVASDHVDIRPQGGVDPTKSDFPVTVPTVAIVMVTVRR
jgi:hypothetical protein